MTNKLFSTKYDWEIIVGDIISHYGRDYQVVKIEIEKRTSPHDSRQKVRISNYLWLRPLSGTDNRIGIVNARGKIRLVKDRHWGRGDEYYRTWHEYQL